MECTAKATAIRASRTGSGPTKGNTAIAAPAHITAAPCGTPMERRSDRPRRVSRSTTGDSASSSAKLRAATALSTAAAVPGLMASSFLRYDGSHA